MPFLDVGMRDGVAEYMDEAVEGEGEEEEAEDEGVMASEVTGEPSVASIDRKWCWWRGWLSLRSLRRGCVLVDEDAVGMLIDADMVRRRVKRYVLAYGQSKAKQNRRHAVRFGR